MKSRAKASFTFENYSWNSIEQERENNYATEKKEGKILLNELQNDG